MTTRAYCPPGRRSDATWALAVAGESVDRLSEHPWLDGGTVIVTRDVPPPPLPVMFDVTPRLPAWLFRPVIVSRPSPLIAGI